MVVGASKMCYYLVSELLHMGMSVKIIDQNEARCTQISELLPRALVIVGDGTDGELLAEEGIDRTDAFVALTGIDEANILMALCAARQTEGCKVIAKINRRSLLELVNSEGMIDSVVSARDVTTELIVQYIRAMESAEGAKIKTLHRLVDGAIEALEFHVDEDVAFTEIPLRGAAPEKRRADCGNRPPQRRDCHSRRQRRDPGGGRCDCHHAGRGTAGYSRHPAAGLRGKRHP